MTDEKAIVVAPEFVPVAGLDELEPSEFSPPRLVLIQPQSDYDGALDNLGAWYNTDTGEYRAQIAVLFVGIAKSRVLFPPEFSRDSETLCASYDGKTPAPGLAGQQIAQYGVLIPDNCADCPLSQWDRRNPPICTLSDNWGGITEDGEAVIIRFARTAAKASRRIKNMARAAAKRKGYLWLRLASRLVRSDNGNYYVPVVVPIAERPSAAVLRMGKDFSAINIAARAAAIPEEVPAAPRPALKPRPAATTTTPGTYNPYPDDDFPF